MRGNPPPKYRHGTNQEIQNNLGEDTDWTRIVTFKDLTWKETQALWNRILFIWNYFVISPSCGQI